MEDNFGGNKLLNIDNDDWWIEDGVLEGCRIVDDVEKVKVPDGVIEMGSYSFDACGIRSLYLPMSVRTISEGAFEGCYKLEKLYIENPDIVLESGCLLGLESLKSVYIGRQKIDVIVADGEYGIGDQRGNCLERYLGDDEAYKVDDDIKRIGETAFINNSTLREVVIPPSVVEIDDNAFSNCSALSQVELPDTLEIIDRYVFQNCTNIKEIKIPKSVYSILDGAFCGWKNNQTIYVPLDFKKIKFLQKWRRGCKANIIYY